MEAESSSRSAVVAFAKQAVLEQAVALVGGQSAADEARFVERVGDVLAETTEDELYEAVQQLNAVGADWAYYPPNPFARRMHHVLGDVAITPDSTMSGLENLDVCPTQQLLILPNHLSYADANLFQILLTRNGRDALASRLTVIAGPKVYSEHFRKFSALCFGSIKTPQSSTRASGEAVMSPREVARVALRTIAQARERLDAGDALLVFAEGTRSRDGRMQQTLAAIARYLDYPGLTILPVGIVGSERLVPIGETRAKRTRVAVSLGRPFLAEDLVSRTGNKKRLLMDVIGVKVAGLLPEAYRGYYDDSNTTLADALEIAANLP